MQEVHYSKLRTKAYKSTSNNKISENKLSSVISLFYFAEIVLD